MHSEYRSGPAPAQSFDPPEPFFRCAVAPRAGALRTAGTAVTPKTAPAATGADDSPFPWVDQEFEEYFFE